MYASRPRKGDIKCGTATFRVRGSDTRRKSRLIHQNTRQVILNVKIKLFDKVLRFKFSVAAEGSLLGFNERLVYSFLVYRHCLIKHVKRVYPTPQERRGLDQQPPPRQVPAGFVIATPSGVAGIGYAVLWARRGGAATPGGRADLAPVDFRQWPVTVA